MHSSREVKLEKEVARTPPQQVFICLEPRENIYELAENEIENGKIYSKRGGPNRLDCCEISRMKDGLLIDVKLFQYAWTLRS